MTKVKTNFTEQTIYVGLDVHKRSWNAALYFNDIRKLMGSKEYKKLYYLLRTITGIGPLTAALLITEIGDMKRFSSFYQLNSFIGLLPSDTAVVKES